MRPSLYNDVHKGIRGELVQLLVRCGSCDPEDAGAVAALAERLRWLQRLLDEHAEHEGRWVEPVLRQHAPMLADALAAEHVALHEQLAGVQSVFASWRRADAEARIAAAAEGYAALAAFVAGYLMHMAREEREAMPAIQAALTDDEIHRVAGQLRASIPPPHMAEWLGLMLPAMNVCERTALFAGMKQQAPPDVVRGLGDLAARVLAADDWAAVRARAQLD